MCAIFLNKKSEPFNFFINGDKIKLSAALRNSGLRLNCHKSQVTVVVCSSGHFLDGFQDLRGQFGRVWGRKIFNGFGTRQREIP